MRYVIGIDFGTLSSRTAVVDPTCGKVLGEATVNYPHGVMDDTLPCGTKVPSAAALQHPDDYLYALKTGIASALENANVQPADVCALSMDFTSCTVVAHKLDGTPVCDIPGFASDPHAYVKLWKSHSAAQEARDFFAVAQAQNQPFLKNHGDQVSSEWMFPKILETYRHSRKVYDAADRFSEAADWLSLMLTGVETHSAPFAGNKAFFEDSYPSADFFEAVEPGFGSVVGDKVLPTTAPILSTIGKLDERGAALSGLCVGTVVAAPQIDAHCSMPALGITRPGSLMLILGTSGCYILHHKDTIFVPGICACVKDSVIPDLCTYEAGIASCGDHLDWFIHNCVPASYEEKARELGMSMHQYLRSLIQDKPVGEGGLIALNWFNGNRCPLSDSDLSGVILGMTLTTRPEQIYRALIEGIAFQTAIILENYAAAGICVDTVIASGGIAKKDSMLMQILSDVTGKTIRVANDSQTSAIGAAIYAAVAAGLYPDIHTASKHMQVAADKVYTPSGADYSTLFNVYKRLHNDSQLQDTLHTLKKLRP